MMPKGVEHSKGEVRKHITNIVRIPMMPKGVEHPTFPTDILPSAPVRIPMMPKGVEHFVMTGWRDS